MIKFHDQVPSVYTSVSRDFQYLSWLINIVLNSVKHNVDDLYNLPNTTSDPRLTELLALTLGFKIKRSYDQVQLAALVAVLPRILKYKGTLTAVEIAGNALITAAKIAGTVECSATAGELTVILPKDLIDISLFSDLLPYILPAGMVCRIVKTNRIKESIASEVYYRDTLVADFVPDLTWVDYNNFAGLATMREIPVSGDPANVQTSLSANFLAANDPNYGLLSNTVIPSLVDLNNYRADEDGNYVDVVVPKFPDPPPEPDHVEETNEFGTTVILNRFTSYSLDGGITTTVEIGEGD